jgi:hypothetical protein
MSKANSDQGTNPSLKIVINYELIKENYKFIKRADGKLLNTQDQRIFDLLLQLTRNDKQTIIDFPWLEEKLLRCQRTIRRILKNLSPVFKYEFYNVLMIEGKKVFNQIVVERTENLERILYDSTKELEQKQNKNVRPLGQKCPTPRTKMSAPYIDKDKLENTKESCIATQSEAKEKEAEEIKKPGFEQNIIKFPQKKLIDFYPLQETDVGTIQSITGRPFNGHAMNEILKDLARKYPNFTFPHKQSFIRLFAKFISKEKRDPEKVNNSNFTITKNLSENAQRLLEEDRKREKRSSYLERRNPCEITEIHHGSKLPVISIFEKVGIKSNSKTITTNQPNVPRRNLREETRIIDKKQEKKAMEISKERGNKLWEGFLGELTDAIGSGVVKNWFGENGGKKEEDLLKNKIIFTVDNTFRFDWIKSNLENVLEHLAQKMDLTIVIQCNNPSYVPSIMIMNEKGAGVSTHG